MKRLQKRFGTRTLILCLMLDHALAGYSNHVGKTGIHSASILTKYLAVALEDTEYAEVIKILDESRGTLMRMKSFWSAIF